jgi:hypothetical protein
MIEKLYIQIKMLTVYASLFFENIKKTPTEAMQIWQGKYKKKIYTIL